MKLLIDTDAFCKLGVAGLLPDVVSRVFGTVISECGRLPALPHMSQRGVLRDRYGGAVCDELIPAARSMPVLPDASIAWLEKLTPIDEIDPGEVQLLACAADSDLFVLTGDKRALRALRGAGGIVDLLKGRVVTLEAVLIALYDKLGPEEVRRRIVPLTKLDNVVSICFSPENPNPRECLVSYFNALADEVEPLELNLLICGIPGFEATNDLRLTPLRTSSQSETRRKGSAEPHCPAPEIENHSSPGNCGENR